MVSGRHAERFKRIEMAGANFLKVYFLLLIALVLLGITIELRNHHSLRFLWSLKTPSVERIAAQIEQPHPSTVAIDKANSVRKYLSYQPPGNGWNNQRIALENALVLAKLLNRTLLVQPLAPHGLGNRLKKAKMPGYKAYNLLPTSDLLPLSEFLDLDLMSEVVPVREIVTSHPEFVGDYSHMTWRNVCHSPGNGFWVDQRPQTPAQEDYLIRQKFLSLGRVWQTRCSDKERSKSWSKGHPVIRYVSDLRETRSDILYFERGTLFGMHIRFISMEGAMEAQSWVVDHVHYNRYVWSTVRKVAGTIGPDYNAIQVRRKNHMDSKLPPSFWMDRMEMKNFSMTVNSYVATNDNSKDWFKPFVAKGYQLFFSVDLKKYLSFPEKKKSVQADFLAIHEQSICIQASKFVGSPASTFTAFILRHRGDVRWRNGLMVDTLHTYWIGHQIKKTQTW